jgi:hypothetical protein
MQARGYNLTSPALRIARSVHIREPKRLIGLPSGISVENPIHRSFFPCYGLCTYLWLFPDSDFGFRGFVIPDDKSSCPLELPISDEPIRRYGPLRISPPG